MESLLQVGDVTLCWLDYAFVIQNLPASRFCTRAPKYSEIPRPSVTSVMHSGQGTSAIEPFPPPECLFTAHSKLIFEQTFYPLGVVSCLCLPVALTGKRMPGLMCYNWSAGAWGLLA